MPDLVTFTLSLQVTSTQSLHQMTSHLGVSGLCQAHQSFLSAVCTLAINRTLGHQLGFVAHRIHLCFQARMSDESHLAPQPRL